MLSSESFVLAASVLSEQDVVLRLLLAAAMGVVVGFERGKSEKPAGPRTMVLIATGAAAFTMLGSDLLAQMAGESGVQVDPTRVLSYLISGIGFLGAGAILHSKTTVTGLTTAATIWATAAYGAACGLGSYMIALTLFGFVVATLGLPWMLTMLFGSGTGEGSDSDAGSATQDE